MPTQGEVTKLLAKVRLGDTAAEERVFALLYDDMTRIAERLFRSQRPHHTLEPSALVHEAYLKIAGAGNEASWQDSAHALAVAARAMRQVLANHARDRAAGKRGGADRGERVTVSGVSDGEGREVDAAALHEALEHLAALDARQARIAELRVLAGLEIERIATLVGVSPRTVELDWKMAKATLKRLLADAGQG